VVAAGLAGKRHSASPEEQKSETRILNRIRPDHRTIGRISYQANQVLTWIPAARRIGATLHHFEGGHARALQLEIAPPVRDAVA